MSQGEQLVEALDAQRRDRRALFRAAAAGLAVAGAGALVATPAAAQAVTDNDILNFALQLEYLEANFFAYATTGSPIDTSLTSGTGTVGTVTAGKQVTFTDPLLGTFFREIASEDILHVGFLRSALGTAAVAQPSIDLGFAADSAFSRAAQAAGLVPAGTAFDAYANDNNFLLAAFLLKDVAVAAYRGAAASITSKTLVEAAAGILAIKAYHSATIREAIYQRGAADPAFRAATDAISNARDNLDGPSDLDQGLSPTTVNGQLVANIVPADPTGLVLGRSPAQTLSVVYLNNAAATSGGFFPAGLNGTIRTSGTT